MEIPRVQEKSWKYQKIQRVQEKSQGEKTNFVLLGFPWYFRIFIVLPRFPVDFNRFGIPKLRLFSLGWESWEYDKNPRNPGSTKSAFSLL